MKILIIVDPSRRDSFEYLIDSNSLITKWELIWDYKFCGKTEHKDFFSTVKERTVAIHYWSDFLTPTVLLKRIKPDKIIFFEIIDLWQIPLIIASKKMGITSFFLEHGVGNSVEHVTGRFSEKLNLKSVIKKHASKIFRNSLGIMKNRVFYFSQVFNVESFVKYLFLPLNLKRYTPIEALSKNVFGERTPDYAILFNRNNVSPFLIYNKIEANRIILNGVPFFDKYFTRKTIEGQYVFFIEHPYLEEKLLGWSDLFHESVAREIEKFAIKFNRKVYIKLHPRSKIENWTRYNLNPNLITILQKEDVVKLMLEAQLILGYSSTFLNIMIQCTKNVVLLGWHPKPIIFGDDISAWRLCHKSYNIEELFTHYEFWVSNNLCNIDSAAYDHFLKEYNYPFDGKATERVLQAIQSL